MEANSSRHRLVRFGAFEVDLRTLELRKHGVRIHLEDQPFHILTLLLQHSGELVTREQLREQLWPEGTFVDFDRSLNKAICKLRLALGDSAEIPRFVETLHRRGYRFISPIQVEELPLQFLHSPPPPPVQVAQGVLSGSGNGIDRVTRFRIQAWHAALAASILLVPAGVTRYLQSRPVSATSGAVSAAVPRRSVAVL